MHDTNSLFEKEASFAYLKRIMPSASESELAKALDSGKADGLEGTVTDAARALGTEILPVEAELDELLTREDLLPALEVGESPRVILGARAQDLMVDSGTGPRRLTRTGVEGGRRRFLVVSPRATLAPLRARKGLARVLAYLGTEREILRSLFAYAICVEGLSLAAPLGVQVLINTIGFGMMTQQLLVISLLLLVALAGAAGLRTLQQVLVEHLSRRFFARTVAEYADRMPLPDVPSIPNPIHRFFEVGVVDKTFFTLGLDLVTLVLQLFAATLLLSLYHPLLMGFTVIMVAGGWVFVRIPFAAAVARNLEESSAKYRLADLLARGVATDLQRHQALSAWQEARERGFSISLGQQIGLLALQVVLSVLLLFAGGTLVST